MPPELLETCQYGLFGLGFLMAVAVMGFLCGR